VERQKQGDDPGLPAESQCDAKDELECRIEKHESARSEVRKRDHRIRHVCRIEAIMQELLKAEP